MPAFPSVSAVAFIMYCRHNWANLMTKIKVGFSALNDFESQYCSSLEKNVGNGCESYDFRLIRLISKKRKPRQPSTNHSSKYSESNREDLRKEEEGPTPFSQALKLLSLSYFEGRSKEGEEKQNS